MEKDVEKLMSRKRLEKWAKIFLIFLAFVWLCTIISKSIYVSGLPIVKTDTASKKYVEHIVETDGIVTAGGEIAVNTQSGLRVDKIYVREGDEVKSGDLLFTIDTTDISDIISAKETELTKLQCNLSDLEFNALIEQQKKEVAILWAKEDYETADKETALAKERAEDEINKAQEALLRHLSKPVPHTSDKARSEAWDNYHDWVGSGYDISDRITAKEREIKDLQEQLSLLDNATKTNTENTANKVDENNTAEPSDIEKILDTTDSDSTPDIESPSTENTPDTTNSDNTPDIEPPSTDNALDTTDSDNTSDIEPPSTDNALDTTDSDNTSDIKGADDVADKDSIQNKENALYGAAGDENKNAAENEKRSELQNKIKNANSELQSLTDELTNHNRNTVQQPDYSAEELEYDTWQNTRLSLEADVQKAIENYNDASYAREVTLRQKMRDIANAEVTTRADSTAVIYGIDIKQLQTQLEGLYALQKQKGMIKAENEGIISKIQINVGGRTSDTAAILMTDEQRPCRFKFSISKEQAKYIHLNDTMELKLIGHGEIEVTADYVMENQTGGYDILCTLPDGKGQPGLSGSIRKAVQGEYHNLALPIDAVYEDLNSSYVYTLNEKEGILGSEYYIEKIKIQIKDKNDKYAAIEPGAISEDTKVITYSTKELKQGDSVRPQDL